MSALVSPSFSRANVAILLSSRSERSTACWNRSTSSPALGVSARSASARNEGFANTSAGPIAMPGATPTPSNTRSSPDRSARSASGSVARGVRIGIRGAGLRKGFAEAVPEQLRQGVGGGALVRPLEEEGEAGALLGRERHHADDALAVDLVAVGADEEVRVELRRGADDHRGGAGVDPGPVHDGDFALDHEGSGSADSPRHTPGDPAERVAGIAGGKSGERALAVVVEVEDVAAGLVEHAEVVHSAARLGHVGGGQAAVGDDAVEPRVLLAAGALQGAE